MSISKFFISFVFIIVILQSCFLRKKTNFDVYSSPNFQLELRSSGIYELYSHPIGKIIYNRKYSSFGEYQISGDTLLLTSTFRNFGFELSPGKSTAKDILEFTTSNNHNCFGYHDRIKLIIDKDTLGLNCQKNGFDLTEIVIQGDSVSLRILDQFYKGKGGVSIEHKISVDILYSSTLSLNTPFTSSSVNLDMIESKFIIKPKERIKYLSGYIQCQELESDTIDIKSEVFNFQYSYLK